MKPDPDNNRKPKQQKIIKRLLVGLILLILGLFLLMSVITSEKPHVLSAPKGSVKIEIADSQELRTQGLSDRESIGSDEGMIFVFDEISAGNCFWMKDMNFSIDMIWLDSNKTVVRVEEFVEPSSYPKSFCPESPAKYGLEIQAYNASELGITEGETLSW